MIARDVRSVRSESCGTSCFWKQKLAVYLVCWDHNVTLSCGASKSMHFLNRCDGLGLTYRSVLANLFCRDVRRCFWFTFWYRTKGLFFLATKRTRSCEPSWRVGCDVHCVEFFHEVKMQLANVTSRE